MLKLGLATFYFYYNHGLTRGDLHNSSTVPGTKCVSLRGFKNEDEKPGSYWGLMHILEGGQVAYNDAAKYSLEVTNRNLLRETKNLPVLSTDSADIPE